MASFTMSKEKLERKIAKMEEEKMPVIVARKPGEERINASLKPMANVTIEINLDTFNKYKMIAKEFNTLSGSILDTMMLLSSWVSHQKINVMEKDAIVGYITRE